MEKEITLFLSYCTQAECIADIISEHKKRYRRVAVDGVIDLAYR